MLTTDHKYTNSSALRALLLCPQGSASYHLRHAISQVDAVRVVKSLEGEAEPEHLRRLLRIYVPHIVFLSVHSLAQAVTHVRVIREEAPGIQIVAVHDTCNSDLLLEVMQIGIQEFLSPPMDADRLLSCLDRVRRQLMATPVLLAGTDLLFSFLPAKQGVGATTLAAATAHAMARESKKRVFLGDFDLNCGLLRFMLKLNTQYSITDAAESVHQIDETLWSQLVSNVGGMDVAHSGCFDPDTRIEPAKVRQLAQQLRRAYDAVFADLSGNFEKFSVELMHESKYIFLVTTPELPSLYLAREKERYLSNVGLADRIQVVMNRMSAKTLIKTSDAEEIIGRPILRTFVNDYASVHRAIDAGKPLDRGSELGEQIQEFAGSLCGEPSRQPKPALRRFVQYFNLVPASYRLGR